MRAESTSFWRESKELYFFVFHMARWAVSLGRDMRCLNAPLVYCQQIQWKLPKQQCVKSISPTLLPSPVALSLLSPTEDRKHSFPFHKGTTLSFDSSVLEINVIQTGGRSAGAEGSFHTLEYLQHRDCVYVECIISFWVRCLLEAAKSVGSWSCVIEIWPFKDTATVLSCWSSFVWERPETYSMFPSEPANYQRILGRDVFVPFTSAWVQFIHLKT